MRAKDEVYVEAQLADGTPIVIRSIRPEDREGIREAMRHMSPETRFRRFFRVVGDPDEAMLSYLTEVDGVDHVALVCTIPTHDLKGERGIGVARFVRLEDDPEVAEAAVTVIDEMQRKGVAYHLMAALTEQARARGVKRFRAYVLEENERVHQLLAEAGAREVQDAANATPDIAASPIGMRTYDTEISPKGIDLARVMRIAASTLVFVFRRFFATTGAAREDEQTEPSDPPAATE